MLNIDELSYDERESIQIMVRSAGWKNLMRLLFTPTLVQTNAYLDAMGTSEHQTHFYRGAKHLIKHLIETVYRIGQMPDPFTEHQQAFLLTLAIPSAERVPTQTEEATKELPPQGPRKRMLTPVL